MSAFVWPDDDAGWQKKKKKKKKGLNGGMTVRKFIAKPAMNCCEIAFYKSGSDRRRRL